MERLEITEAINPVRKIYSREIQIPTEMNRLQTFCVRKFSLLQELECPNKEKHFQRELWRVQKLLKEEEIAKAKFPNLDSSTQQKDV
jgi:hypothetical protein